MTHWSRSPVFGILHDVYRQKALRAEPRVEAPELRQLYERLWESGDYLPEDYHPMQVDMAFGYASSMCASGKQDSSICQKWCPFGVFEERSSLCARRAGAKCSVLLYTSRCVSECTPERCLIADDGFWKNEPPVCGVATQQQETL